MSTLMQSAMEVRAYACPRPVTRQSTPHLRCGICDQALESAPSVYVDDERCHLDCAGGDQREPADVGVMFCHCGALLRERELDGGYCLSCGGPLR